MIDIAIDNNLLILLRASLLLFPLIAAAFLVSKNVDHERYLVAGLFSFLYSFALLLPAHALAVELDLWHYGSQTLSILGMPADIWFAGSFLFGPCVFLAFPKLNPFIFTISFIIIQAFTFKSLDPFVIAGNYWFVGVVLIFLIVHIPALYLAKWTALDTNLNKRASLLAIGYGFLAFFVLPTIIMKAMGGSWAFADKSIFNLVVVVVFLTPCMIMGLSAVHMFVVHGEGTPIPLDRTKHLVTIGLYSYITNPMQLCTALSWVIIGIYLKNFYVALAAGMAVIFVLGLVRWHHRNDLLIRFPNGWPEYKSNVPEWFPRWKPWMANKSVFYWNNQSQFQRTYANWIQRNNPVSLGLIESDYIGYTEGNRGLSFKGTTALLYPLFHTNFIYALIASGILLIVLPLQVILPNFNRPVSRVSNDAP